MKHAQWIMGQRNSKDELSPLLNCTMLAHNTDRKIFFYFPPDNCNVISSIWLQSCIYSVCFQNVLYAGKACQVLFIWGRLVLADRVHWRAPKLSVMGEATSQRVPCPFIGKDLLKQPASDNSIENLLLGMFPLQLQWPLQNRCREGELRRDKDESRELEMTGRYNRLTDWTKKKKQ